MRSRSGEGSVKLYLINQTLRSRFWLRGRGSTCNGSLYPPPKSSAKRLPPLASAARFQIRYAYPVSLVIEVNGARTVLVALRIALVGQENQIKDVRFLFSPLTTPLLWPPKREDNAVSSIADEIWQYRTSGNLTIFNKDHDTAEEGQSQVRQK